MNRYILLAAGALALITGCDNGNNDSTTTGGAQSRQLFCTATRANADAAMLTLTVSPDMNTIMMTETPQTEPGTGNGADEANESGIPSAGLTFTRVADDNNDNANDEDAMLTFTAPAAEGTTAMTMTVDRALLEGDATGNMRFGNQNYNCATDSNVANPENPDDENTGTNP